MSRCNSMKKAFSQTVKPALAWILIISVLAAACSQAGPVIPIPSETAPAETAAATESPPEAATPSPTQPPLPDRVILLVPPGNDPLQLEIVQPILEELATQEGYRLEILSSLSADKITPDMRLIVSLPPDPGLGALAASTRETPFFAIGIPGLEESPNITSAFVQENSAHLQGFMGGIIAALITPDWRAGVISISDTPEGMAARNGFINGVIYFCGTCRQIYPPFFDSQNQLIQYPLYEELPSGAAEIEWQSAVDTLIERGVETIYVYPGAGGEALLSYLAEAGVNIIGGAAPPEGLQKNWVASIHTDPSSSWSSKLQKILQGQEVSRSSGDLQIDFINPDLLSPGRQKFAEAVLEDLLAGYIEAGMIEEPASEP